MEYDSFKENTSYKISILAIDKYGNVCKNSKEYKTSIYTYTKKILEFPMITANGICNVKVECNQDDSKSYYAFDKSMGSTTNPNSLPIKAYDGDMSTFAGPYNIVSRYLSIDPSAVGKKITVTANEKYKWYWLAEYLSYNKIRDFGDTRTKTYTITLPNDADKYLFRCYGNEDACFYEITVSD